MKTLDPEHLINKILDTLDPSCKSFVDAVNSHDVPIRFDELLEKLIKKELTLRQNLTKPPFPQSGHYANPILQSNPPIVSQTTTPATPNLRPIPIPQTAPQVHFLESTNGAVLPDLSFHSVYSFSSKYLMLLHWVFPNPLLSGNCILENNLGQLLPLEFLAFLLHVPSHRGRLLFRHTWRIPTLLLLLGFFMFLSLNKILYLFLNFEKPIISLLSSYHTHLK